MKATCQGPDCGCDDCGPVTGGPQGARRADLRGRFPTEAPAAGANPGFTRDFDRNYDVEWQSGMPVSTVWPGRWGRGSIVRQSQPAFQLPPGNPMWDPTDPAQWHDPGF